jgi:hypothetical protein
MPALLARMSSTSAVLIDAQKAGPNRGKYSVRLIVAITLADAATRPSSVHLIAARSGELIDA